MTSAARFRLQGALLMIGLLLVGFAVRRHPAFMGSVTIDMTCDETYVLLNPYLRCTPEEPVKKTEYTVFKGYLEAYIGEKKRSGAADTVAVYFRDLENGPWFGIEEDALFSPASLLKLPVLITYYQRAQLAPQLLEVEIETEGSTAPSDINIDPAQSLQSGESYTIEELLRRMIVHSDNAALHLLLSFLTYSSPEEDIFADTLASMGIAKSEAPTDDFLTVKRYSAFYRALYNASYLNKEMSQKALHLLTQTTFHQGIDDGVPEGIPVAHKYGIRRQDESVQLHDCGIVYYPETHYLLCIMTRGKDTDALSSMIREIAAMVHAEVVLRNGQ